MSQPEPEPFGTVEIGAHAEVIPADEVQAEQAEPEEEDPE
jgi:hypothetical protein